MRGQQFRLRERGAHAGVEAKPVDRALVLVRIAADTHTAALLRKRESASCLLAMHTEHRAAADRRDQWQRVLSKREAKRRPCKWPCQHYSASPVFNPV